MVVAQRGDQGLGLGGAGDLAAAAADDRELETDAGIHGYLTERARASVDRANREQRSPDRGRAQSRRVELVDEALKIRPPNLAEPGFAELGRDRIRIAPS